MHGNKENHEAMWQYIIDHIDTLLEDRDRFKLTFIVVDQIKRKWIIEHVPFVRFVGLDLNYCFACAECNANCNNCPIANKAGLCKKDDSVYMKLLNAIKNGKREDAIMYAEVIRDAWEDKA